MAAPIVLVIDNMDQSYIQQSLPPVSSFSVQKLIKRRLERDFGKNDIKGAISLGRDTGGRKDWNFLMVALERSHCSFPSGSISCSICPTASRASTSYR